MIEGVDITIAAPPDRDALVDCLHAIREVWPQAVAECADGDAPPLAIAEFQRAGSCELFVYRDAAAADAWRAEGGTPELSDMMIHLLQENGEITIVVGDPSHPATSPILEAVRRSLESEELPASADARRAG